MHLHDTCSIFARAARRFRMRWYLRYVVNELEFAAAWPHRNYVLFMIDVNRLLLWWIEKTKNCLKHRRNSTKIMSAIHLDNLGGQRHSGINGTHEVLLQGINIKSKYCRKFNAAGNNSAIYRIHEQTIIAGGININWGFVPPAAAAAAAARCCSWITCCNCSWAVCCCCVCVWCWFCCGCDACCCCDCSCCDCVCCDVCCCDVCCCCELTPAVGNWIQSKDSQIDLYGWEPRDMLSNVATTKK